MTQPSARFTHLISKQPPRYIIKIETVNLLVIQMFSKKTLVLAARERVSAAKPY